MWKPTNTEMDAVARDSFTFAGVRYEPGDAFPHKALGVIPLSLYGLWRAQLIRFVEPAASADAAPSERPQLPRRKRQRSSQRAE